MTTVRVEAPARLHMGMLDVSGEGPRRFGGLGVAVSQPAVVVEVSDDLTTDERAPTAPTSVPRDRTPTGHSRLRSAAATRSASRRERTCG